MSGERLSRVSGSFLLRRHRGRLGIGRVSRSFGRISSRRRGRRRVQRRQMHIVALRWEWWRGGNLLIGIGRRGRDRRRRSVLTTKVQPLLNVLGAPSHTAEHSGLLSRRRGGRHGRLSQLCRGSLDRRRRDAGDTLLLSVSRGDLHHRGHWLRPVVEDDLLRPAHQGVRVAHVLVAGESWILAAVSVDQTDRLDASRRQFGHLRLILVLFFGDLRLDISDRA